MSAIISACGTYRYELGRIIENGDKPVSVRKLLFIMLNPSTADAELDDPTIRRCKGFARDLGYSHLTVANLYALRATNPADLWLHANPVGEDNDRHLYELSQSHEHIICAWGANAKAERVAEVVKLLEHKTLWCLGMTKAGHPRHPLYIKADQELVKWEFDKEKDLIQSIKNGNLSENGDKYGKQ